MSKNKTYLGHRERLRKRYLSSGYKSLLDYEVLELILTFVIPRKDTKELAKTLIKYFNTLEKVFKADTTVLSQFEGISERIAIYLKLLGDLNLYSFEDKIKKENLNLELKTKNQLINYLKNNIGFDKNEAFKVLFLDSANRIISFETLFTGTIDKSAIYPRKILERVLFHNARSIIFAHNHPSGNTYPSRKDIELTKNMENFFKMVDVNIIDHIIIGKDSYFSFLEEGIL
ncbi:MAG: DNA repair protein RadC [Fusobacterium sp. JB019]|nr:DNA repair protein RadC [Fusobacterium sp. JB019]